MQNNVENTSLPPATLLAKFSLGVLARPLGGHKVLDVYNRMRKEKLYNKDFWDAVVEELDVNYVFDSDALTKIPKTGPIVVVANHHLGILDSLGLAYILSKVRSDFKIMAISKIKDMSVIAGIKSQLIFVPDKPSKDLPHPGLVAQEHLINGGSVMLFPSGFLAVPEKESEYAFDPKWKSGVLKFAQASNAQIIPMYFNSQNSSFFRNLTKVMPATKHALLLREALKKKGQEIVVSIGKPIKVEDLPGPTLHEKANVLRSLVYGLGLKEMECLKSNFKLTAKEKRLIEEHRKAMFQYLPGSMHLHIPLLVKKLFFS